jgi:hypothetical protein
MAIVDRAGLPIAVHVASASPYEPHLVPATLEARFLVDLPTRLIGDVTGAAFYERRHPDVEFTKVCLTNQFFNAQAHANAALNSVELLEQTHLTEMLEHHTVTMVDVERVLYAEWVDRHRLTGRPTVDPPGRKPQQRRWLLERPPQRAWESWRQSPPSSRLQRDSRVQSSA